MKTCGHTHFRSGAESPLWEGHGEIGGNFLYKIKKSAESRGIEFKLTIEQIWDLFLKQNRKCKLSGLELKFKKSHKETNTASLDRIDSKKDYEIDNVQWVHKDVNIMKQDMSDENFIYYCGKVYENSLKNKN